MIWLNYLQNILIFSCVVLSFVMQDHSIIWSRDYYFTSTEAEPFCILYQMLHELWGFLLMLVGISTNFGLVWALGILIYMHFSVLSRILKISGVLSLHSSLIFGALLQKCQPPRPPWTSRSSLSNSGKPPGSIWVLSYCMVAWKLSERMNLEQSWVSPHLFFIS